MWTCPTCKEEIEDQFDTCWRCAGDSQHLVRDDVSDTRKEFTPAKKILISLVITVVAGGIALILAAPDLATGRERTAPLLYPYAFWMMRYILSDRLFISLILGPFPMCGAVFAYAWLRHRPAKALAGIAFFQLLFAFSLTHLLDVERQYQTWPSN